MINRQITILIILIAMLGASVYWLVWPAWDALGQAQDDLTAWSVKVSKIKEIENTVALLSKRYSNSADADKLLLALPKDEDKPGLLVQLENLASTNGLILNSVEFTEMAGKRNNAAGAGAPVAPTLPAAPAGAIMPVGGEAKNSPSSVGLKTVQLSLQLNGDSKSLMNFLSAVENNLRIMDIDSIDFKVAVSEGGLETGTNFSIKLNTYYKNN